MIYKAQTINKSLDKLDYIKSNFFLCDGINKVLKDGKNMYTHKNTHIYRCVYIFHLHVHQHICIKIYTYTLISAKEQYIKRTSTN